jgi:CBS domain-containing protein
MTRAEDIMTKDVVTVDASATVADLVKLMKERSVRATIVERTGRDDAYGIVTQRDVVYSVVAEGRDPKQVTVREIMTKPVVVITPDLEVESVARLMAERGLSRAPVVSDQELRGVVSVTDIIEKAL